LRRLGSNNPAGGSLRSRRRTAAWPIGRRMRHGPPIDRNTSAATTFGSGAVSVFWVITAAVRRRCAAKTSIRPSACAALASSYQRHADTKCAHFMIE
jgi:hypothetical protein